MIIVTGSVTARPDTFDALRQASLDHVHRSRTEEGCLYHSVQADCENPLRLFFYEQWRDLGALQVHATVAGSREFLGQISRLGRCQRADHGSRSARGSLAAVLKGYRQRL